MASLHRLKEDLEFSEEEYSNCHDEYDCYGKTPPRTKLLRKYRERKGRDKETVGFLPKSKSSPRMSKKIVPRRNTISSMFDELISKADSSEPEPGKRVDKRSIKLLRGSERDLKLDIVSAQGGGCHDAGDPMPMTPRRIESCKRFMSLCSKRVTPAAANGHHGRPTVNRSVSVNLSHTDADETYDCPQSRIDFHNTLRLLINMKSFPERNPRRALSREEHLWQTELKDIIWLELRALRADRTASEEDTFLCLARESVGPLLNTIMTYKFERNKKRLSAQSCDSGVEEDCSGCLSMYCQCCMESQNMALREVEDLMSRLEEAESLFPSSRAFADMYPPYSSAEFVGRVKAMCLWYNMTKHQRLKLVILGKLLALLENKYYQWPIQYDESCVDSSSPTDSNSSNSSINDYLNDKTPIDLYNISPIATLVSRKNENSISPYRRYIENILKTRGLGKSMSFLDRLHKHVLRKSQITLQKPTDESIFDTILENDDHDEELVRYGCWSPEAKSLALPSYKAAFLFLSAVPLEVIHEFLRMRLEQKPVKPSPLSVRQLMRELKEGIKIAVSQRQRISAYWRTVVDGEDELSETYRKNIKTFDKTLLLVLKDYLEYMGTWALFQHDTFQKSLLEEEWHFICSNVKDIPEAFDMAGNKYCSILETMMTSIGKRLMERIEELAVEINDLDDEQNRKQNLFAVCRELQALFNDEREMSVKVISFAKTIFRSGINIHNFVDFKTSIVSLKCTIPNAIERVQNICDTVAVDNLDESEKAFFVSRCREILMQGYTFGFEFYKEMSDFVPRERKKLLARSMVQFAHLWMNFAQQRCERGRGKRPRWAYQGMDFLLAVCEPHHTQYLTDGEFEELKENMDKCISHVIGTTAPSTPDSGFYSSSPRPSLELGRFPKSRGSSPSPRPTYKSQRSASRKTSVEQNSPIDPGDAPVFTLKREDSLHETLLKMKHAPLVRAARVKDAIYQLDMAIDANLRKEDLIGAVVTKQQPDGVKHVRRKNVVFCWQRGIKIGQGRFGKVYTAVNNDTGEMMAVKEVAIQHNDIVSIRKITEEIKIMEGICHTNLVKYYGLEVHKEEMLIFMEFCPEGTLESLVAGTENGLPEPLTRRYTYQLLNGVSILHDHGIVHRDIKTANIFLTDEGNCLKIGDFGCAVKIKSHVTMPGELQGFVGTQAYMAPEMFMKTSVEGHGRAADIWSVGCVVVEMASGKRPWAEYDSNYQIMFKVGMGEKPEAPDSLIDEGHDFLERCFQHDPKKRASAFELLNHNFVKVGDSLN